MKTIKVAINGFGRIGRVTFRAMLSKNNIDVVAINDLTDTRTLAHLLKYDSIHGPFPAEVAFDAENLIVNGKKIRVYSEREPTKLNWKKHAVNVLIESTGRFVDEESAGKHIEAGAAKVIISAPAKGNIKTIVLGVNEQTIDAADRILSNASCTTNNAAPMIKVLDENWGVEWGFITTIHAYTGDQNLQDAPHKDLRRARAATQSIIPTSTGAAKAITEIFPHLKGKLGGAGMRVPVINGSLTDLTCILKKPASATEINEAFRNAADSSLNGILQYTEDPVVSTDIIGNPHSCIFDAELTTALGTMVKTVGWYDNEMGYSCRLAELVERIG